MLLRREGNPGLMTSKLLRIASCVRLLKISFGAKTNKISGKQPIAHCEGMVPFVDYFKLYRKLGITGPLSIHFEYPVFSKEEAKLSKFEKTKIAYQVMRRDLEKLRGYLEKVGM